MTNDPAEGDLRERFRALREHDDAAIPAFALSWAGAKARARRRRSIPARAWIAGGGLAAAALAFWLILNPRLAPPELAPAALPGWQTPTDSLLAGAGEAAPRLSWAALPTDGLGRPSFNRTSENR